MSDSAASRTVSLTSGIWSRGNVPAIVCWYAVVIACCFAGSNEFV